MPRHTPDWRPLAVLTLVVAVLAGAGLFPRWPGLVHLVALAPLDQIGDLGVLLVFATGWPVFLLGVAGSLAVRVTVLALMLGGLTRERIGLAVRFYLVTLPFSFLAAALLYGAPALLFYGLFWAGFLVALLVLVGFAALPWQATERLRRGLGRSAGSWFRAGTVLAYLALLTLIGAVADLTGELGSILLVPVSAALTWSTLLVLRDPARLRLTRRALAALPVAGLAALAVVVMTGPAAPPRGEEPVAPRDGSLLLMSGIDSASGSGAILEIDPHVVGFACEQTYYYSYAGPGDGQPRNDALCPITTGAPYGPDDTLRSRDELVHWFVHQVEPLTEPVTAAVHSQGVWIAWEAVADGAVPNLETLVLVGVYPTNPVAYPTEPDRRAPGRVGADLLRLAEQAPRPGGTTVFALDAPLSEEWLGHPDRIQEMLARPLPDEVTAVAVASVFDLPLMPDGPHIDGTTDACPVPVTHPNMPYGPELLTIVDRAIDGEPLDDCPVWRTAIGPLFRHHTVPPN